MRATATLCFGLALAVAGSVRAETAVQGSASTLHGVLVVEGKQIPLPDGRWTRVGQAARPDGVVSIALLHLGERGKVEGGMLVQVNKEGAPSSWGVAPDCDRSDLLFSRVRYQSDHDGSCAFVARLGGKVDDAAADPVWRAAQRTAVVRDWALPREWAVAGVRVTDAREAVQIYYAFPLAKALDSQDTASLVSWTLTAWDSAERGLLNQLDPARPLPPWLRDVVLAAPPAITDQPESGVVKHQMLWKTLTFRTVSTAADFTGNVIATGNLVTAALMSAFATVTGPWIYLAHELAWDHYGNSAASIVDLPGLGPELP